MRHTHTQPHILTHKRSLTHAHNQHTFSFFTHIVSVSHTQTKRDKKWEERCFFLIRLACTILYFLSLDCSLLLSVFNKFLDIGANTHVNTPRGLIHRELRLCFFDLSPIRARCWVASVCFLTTRLLRVRSKELKGTCTLNENYYNFIYSPSCHVMTFHLLRNTEWDILNKVSVLSIQNIRLVIQV